MTAALLKPPRIPYREMIKGSIEWYDRNSIKVNRSPEPSVLLLKHYIKYMYKENEDKEVD